MKATAITRTEGGKVRLSNSELHRRASGAIREAGQVVFENLPSLVTQIIENEVWKDYEHKDFASYVLDYTSNGLGINTNQRLWILRCSMDVQGKHIAEWADVLAKVEEMVRVEADKGGKTIRSFGSNSLESLAKDVSHMGHTQDRITYLPSRQSHDDGHLVRLRKNNPEVYERVVSREISMVQARKAAGLKVSHDTNLGRAKSAFGKMLDQERAEFLEWLPGELTTDEKQALKVMLDD